MKTTSPAVELRRTVATDQPRLRSKDIEYFRMPAYLDVFYNKAKICLIIAPGMAWVPWPAQFHSRRLLCNSKVVSRVMKQYYRRGLFEHGQGAQDKALDYRILSKTLYVNDSFLRRQVGVNF